MVERPSQNGVLFNLTMKEHSKKYLNAQLVFTTHDTWQLSNQLLRRDEIWFAEKDEEGVSTLYSLADFVDEDGTRIRKDESCEKNYLIGKYGAIPMLKTIDIFKDALIQVSGQNGLLPWNEEDRIW